MKIIPVNLKERSYNIIIGANSLDSLGKSIAALDLGNDAYIITNANIKNKYGKRLQRALSKSKFNSKFKLIADTEKSKSLESACAVIQGLAEYAKQKRIFIIAFGGGVIGDLSGFIASIYKRGTPYIQIATTLLAQVDSSIGGKTGVDLAQGKNLVGAFYQPKLVFSDISLLKTLDLRQINNGLAEVIKYGIIKDKILFNYLEKKYSTGHSQKNTIKELDFEFIITRCGYIKAKIVAQDERENLGVRTILNFGHTIGHAIETAGGYKTYSHGEAIALGMLVAADISVIMGIACRSTQQRIEGIIKSVGLPVKIAKLSLKGIIKAHYCDKKFSGTKNKFVLIEKIGTTKIIEAVPIRQIIQALETRYR